MSAPEVWGGLDRCGFEVARLLLAVSWQSSILFLAAGLLCLGLRKRRASARHALWLGALLMAPILPLLGSLATSSGAPQAPVAVIPVYEAPEAHERLPVVDVRPESTLLAPEASYVPDSVPPEPQVARPVVSRPFSIIEYPWALGLLAYLLGLLLFAGSFVAGHARIFWWIRAGSPARDGRILDAFARARDLSGISRKVAVLETPRISAPVTVGLLRAVVLLPYRLAERLSDKDLDALALHETAHARRHDALVLSLVALVRAALFFHPLVWLAARQIAVLAEHAADDAVLDATGEPVSYAKLLTRIAADLPRHTPATEYAAGIVLSRSAFLKRVEAILSDRRDQIRRLTRWALAATVAAVILSLGVSLALPLCEDRSFRVSGDDFDIELLGVVFGGTDEVYDAAGNRKSADFGRLYLDEGHPRTWDDDELRRDFVFGLPETDGPVTYISAQAIPHGFADGELVSFNTTGYVRDWRGGGEGVFKCLLPKKPRHGPSPPRYVDVVVRYYQGERGVPDAVFDGPFQVGETHAGGETENFTLEVREEFPGQIEFTVSGPLTLGAPLILYTRDGSWRLAQYGGGGFSRDIGHFQFRLNGLPLKDVARVTLNEQPREKTFHNVKVHYPGRTEPDHVAWLDEVAERLGLDPSDPTMTSQHRFESPREALAVLDLVRGPMLHKASQEFCSGELSPEDFSEEELNGIRSTAQGWLQSPDTRVRSAGIGLALLWGKWPEFIDPALDLIQLEHGEASEAIHALVRCNRLMTQEQLTRVRDVLLLAEGPSRRHMDLLWCLRHRQESPNREHSLDLLVDLAGCDMPWLWWPVLDEPDVVEALIRRDDLPEAMRVRLVMAGKRAGTPDPGRYAEQARVALAELLTPEFYYVSTSSFAGALRRYADNVDAEEGTSVLLGFLRRLIDEWDDYREPDRSLRSPWAVDRVVKYLNLWHGVDIGGLGDDVTQETQDLHVLDWKAVAEEALVWGGNGVDPSKLAAGWAPDQGDLRVVWRNLKDPELSMIGVWTGGSTGPGAQTYNVMRLADEFLNYRVEGSRQGRISIVAGGSNGAEGEPFPIPATDGSTRVPTDEPLRLRLEQRWGRNWEVWLEPGSAEESVLSDTDVFAAWARQYLSPDGLATPLPRVFAQQPQARVKEYLISRQLRDGWSEAEVALREAMHQDLDFVKPEFRPYWGEHTPEDAIDAWQKFLERDDLTPEMQILAWWRLGALNSYNSRGSHDDDAAMRGFAMARHVDPDFVCDKTINATTNLASIPVYSTFWAHTIADCYEWLVSRTDEMLEESVSRPMFWRLRAYTRGTQYQGVPPRDRVGEEAKKLRKSVETAIESMERNMDGRIESLRRKDREVAARLEQQLADIRRKYLGEGESPDPPEYNQDPRREGVRQQFRAFIDGYKGPEGLADLDLRWSDIPALLELADSEAVLYAEHYAGEGEQPLRYRDLPRSPESTLLTTHCFEGMVALWLVEGLRRGQDEAVWRRQMGNEAPTPALFVPLNPIVHKGGVRPATDKLFWEVYEGTLAAYRAWWLRVMALPPEEAALHDPLDLTGLAWWGGGHESVLDIDEIREDQTADGMVARRTYQDDEGRVLRTVEYVRDRFRMTKTLPLMGAAGERFTQDLLVPHKVTLYFYDATGAEARREEYLVPPEDAGLRAAAERTSTETAPSAPGSKFTLEDVRTYHRERANWGGSDEDLKRVYTNIALHGFQGADRDLDAMEDAMERALAFDQDDATRAQLFVYLGDAYQMQTRKHTPEIWGPQRRKAAEAHLAGLRVVLRNDLPEKPPENAYMVVMAPHGDSLVDDEIRRRNKERQAAMRETKRIRDLVSMRQTLIRQIVYIYSREPKAFDELHDLALAVLGSEEAATQLVSAAKAYEGPESPTPAIGATKEPAPEAETLETGLEMAVVTPTEVQREIERLSSDDPKVRAKAARALAAMGAKAAPAVSALIGLLADDQRVQVSGERSDTSRVRWYAEEALVAIGRPAVAPLVRRLGHPDRQEGSKAIGILHTLCEPVAVPLLIEALDDDKSRDYAARVLEWYGELAALPLIGTLEHDDAAVRVQAAKSLGELRARQPDGSMELLNDLRAVEPLLRRVREDDDREVRCAAVTALKGYGRECRAVDTLFASIENGLIAALDDEAPEARQAATESLAHLEAPRAVKPLVETLADPEPAVRATAASAFNFIPHPESVAPLLALLDDGDAEVRRSAAGALGMQMDRAAVTPLTRLLQEDSEEGVRSAAAQALGKLRASSSVDALLKTLRGGEYHERLSAICALRDLEDPRIVEGLAKASKDDDENMRLFAISALGNFHDPRAIDPLLAALDEENYDLRANAVRSLRGYAEPRVVGRLTAMLEDKHPYVVWTAAHVVGDMRLPRTIPALVGAIDRVSDHILNQDFAAEFVFDYRSGHPALSALIAMGTAAAAPLAAASYRESGQVDFDVAWALGQIGDARALEPLMTFVDHSHWISRKDVANALGKIGGPEALDTLVELLDDEHERVRMAARSNLGQITGESFGDDQEKWRAWLREQATPYVFTGSVTDTDTDGQPIEGALVLWRRIQYMEPLFETVADARGRYRLEVTETGGNYVLMATAEGRAPKWRGNLTLAARGTETKVDFALAEGHWLEGVAVDKDTGEPVAGLPLQACAPWEDHISSIFYDRYQFMALPGRECVTVTDAEGRFRFDSLPAGKVSLRTDSETYSTLARNYVVDKRITLELWPRVKEDANIIRGRVVDDATGEPITRFSITVNASEKEFEDPDGRFVFPDLPRYRYRRVWADAEGFATGIQRDVLAARGDEVEDIEIRLKPGKRLEGIVVDERTGAPISGAKLLYSYDPTHFNWGQWDDYDRHSGDVQALQRTSTSADGRFRFSEVEEEKGTLCVLCEGYGRKAIGPEQRDYDPERGHVRITLAPGSYVHGVRTRAGKRIPEALVQVSPVGGLTLDTLDRQFELEPLTTDTYGRFRIGKLQAGSYNVFVMERCGNLAVPADRRVVTLGEGEDVEVNLGEPAGPLSLKGCTLAQGKPQAWCFVSLTPEFDCLYKRYGVFSDAEGRYEFSGLAPGSYAVTVSTRASGMLREAPEADRVIDLRESAEIDL